MSVREIGVEEDRTKQQFTAEILRHPPGKPGYVYVAVVEARIRADTLGELRNCVADFAWEMTDADGNWAPQEQGP